MKKTFINDTSCTQVEKTKEDKIIISLCVKDDNNNVTMISTSPLEKNQLLDIINNKVNDLDIQVQDIDQKNITLSLTATDDKNNSITTTTSEIIKEELISFINN